MLVSINLSQEEINKSAWLAYMVNENSWKFQVPGPAYGSTYKFFHSDFSGTFGITQAEGTGEVYDPIEIVRIESSETVDNRKQKGDSIIPDDLDTSDYEAVADYYNFYSE